MTSGTLGFGSDAIPIVALVDTGSDQTFISSRTLERLVNPIIKPATPISVRLTNGVVTTSDRILRAGITLGDFKTICNFRVLEWNAYDVILGMNWLKRHEAVWDVAESRLGLVNGSGRRSYVRMRPHKTIDSLPALAELGLNALSYKKAQKAIRERPDTIQLYLLRDKEGKEKDFTNTPQIVDSRYEPIVEKYRRLFREELPEKLAPTREIQHEIDTGDAKPINRPYYPLSQEHRVEQENQIRTLLEKGLIRPSASAWGSPVLFVAKPGGKWRMCVDYRMLNNVTRKDAYPLPRIQDCLDDIGKAKRLSKIDLTSGYWQIRVNEMSIPKTAFNTRSGKYEFIAMPFGLCNAPATFQRIMNDALRDFLGKFVVVYLDDIVIYSDSDEEHEKHLEQVFETLRKHELYAKPSKCVFGTPTLDFCGHIVGNGQVKPNAAKIQAILDWPTPRNVHEVRQFLGLASYYRRYISNFAQIASPLSDLLVEADSDLRKKKFRPVRWTPTAQLAFNALKRKLVEDPVLSQPDRELPYRIETDASEWAIGCVLLQLGPDGKWHPIAYDGRKLNGAELNYPVHEKELLAIKYALRTWNEYIQNGTTTEVVTDHESLKYLTTTKTPSKRLARWIDEFSEYQLDIKYRKGSEAIVPDAISRRPDFVGRGPANVAWTSTNAIEVDCALNPLDIDYNWEQAMIAFLQDGIEPEDPEQRRQTVELADIKEYEAEDGILYRKMRNSPSSPEYRVPFVATPNRRHFLEHYHKAFGHWSYPAIEGITRARGWWPQMAKDLKDFSNSCRECQLAQRPRPRLERETPQHIVSKDIRPFEKWAIDFIGQLPCTPHGNRWLLTAIDIATGWPLARAIPEATAEAVADFLYEEIYCKFGAPKELLSDNGANLTAAITHHINTRMKTRHRYTTPYHPRTNGKVERLNGMLGSCLTKALIDRPTIEWDEVVHEALFACRIRAHSVSKISPFVLVYGMEPRVHGTDDEFKMQHIQDDFEARMEFIHTARHEANALLVRRAIQTQKLRHQAMLEKPSRKPFSKGNLVLVRNEDRTKFEPTYFGPFRILAVRPFGTYTLETMDGKKVLRNLINGSRLVEYIPNKFVDGAIPNGDNAPTMTPAAKRRLKVQGTVPGDIGDVTPELLEVLDRDGPVPPTYEELSLMTRQEWENTTYHGHDRGRSSQVGEGLLGADILAKARKRRGKKTKRNRVRMQTESISEVGNPESRPDVAIEAPTTVVMRNSNEQSPRQGESGVATPGLTSAPALNRQENARVATPVPAHEDLGERPEERDVATSRRSSRPQKEKRQTRRLATASEDTRTVVPQVEGAPEPLPVRERTGARNLRAKPRPKQWSPIDRHT